MLGRDVSRTHVRLLVGLVAVYLLLHRVATSAGSTRGEVGIVVRLFAQAGVAEETLFGGYLFAT